MKGFVIVGKMKVVCQLLAVMASAEKRNPLLAGSLDGKVVRMR